MKSVSKHMPHYAGLLGIFVLGVIGFVVFRYDQVFQYSLAIALSVSYVVWGIIHHWLHKDLHASVIVEYMAIATLGLVVMIGLISST